jgi:2,5-diamino-6-(ribosylamino)-4(3H)-pyrimidinone 5'-phosphate reductase
LTEKILRLYPLPVRELPTDGLYENLELLPPERDYVSRPYVVINVVSSVDGRTAIGGKSSRIGSETDRRVMRTLRSKADAVMIGANTVRAERLSLGLEDTSFGAQPLAVIVTRTGDVPLRRNLIVGERQEVLVITTEHAPENLEEQLAGQARVLRVSATLSGAVDLGDALRILKAERAVGLLLVEGGPSLNHALISSNLADELFLTLAPKLYGGTREETLTVLDGPLLAARNINLISAHLAGDELFLRYTLHPLPPTTKNSA